MSKFTKKPALVEAEQFTSARDLTPDFSKQVCWCFSGGLLGSVLHPHIHTLEGTMRLSEGDWIIKGVEGEFYPCKRSIFEATYDPA